MFKMKSAIKLVNDWALNFTYCEFEYDSTCLQRQKTFLCGQKMGPVHWCFPPKQVILKLPKYVLLFQSD